MANLIHPDLWNSAYRPIFYRWPYPAYKFNDVQNAGGFASINVGTFVIGLTTVGQKAFITGGIYAGDCTVRGSSGNYLIVSKPYIGPSTTPPQAIRLAQTFTADFYVGYQSSHEGYSDHPYRRVAQIQHPAQNGGEAKVDVSGYIQAAFGEVKPPRIGADFTMSMPFRLIPTIGGPYAQFDRYAIRGTLPHSALSAFDSNYSALNAQTPIHFNNGVTIYSMIWPDTSIHGEHIVNVLGVSGTGGSTVSLGVGFDTISGTFTVG